MCGQRRAVVARSQQPDVGRTGPDWLGSNARAFVVSAATHRAARRRDHAPDRDTCPGLLQFGLPSARMRIVCWSLPGARPIPRSIRPGKQRLQHAEILRDLVGAVVRQHHAARTDPHALRQARNTRDQHFRRRARQRLAAVMFGQPDSAHSRGDRKAAPTQGLAHGVCRRATLADRRLIENAETQRQRRQGGPSCPSPETCPGGARAACRGRVWRARRAPR